MFAPTLVCRNKPGMKHNAWHWTLFQQNIISWDICSKPHAEFSVLFRFPQNLQNSKVFQNICSNHRTWKFSGHKHNLVCLLTDWSKDITVFSSKVLCELLPAKVSYHAFRLISFRFVIFSLCFIQTYKTLEARTDVMCKEVLPKFLPFYYHGLSFMESSS